MRRPQPQAGSGLPPPASGTTDPTDGHRTGQASPAPTAVERVTRTAVLLVPAFATLLLSFRAGGFYADTTAVLAAVFVVLVVLRVTLAERPFEGLGAPAALAGGALGLFAAWTLGSALWSGAPGRALVEWDRALLYLLAFLLFACLGRAPGDLARLVRSLAGAFAVVCAVSLATRLLPDIFMVAPGLVPERLEFPLTYWNALGLVAALGLILCVHLGSNEREPVAARVLGAAACPVLACTLLFTFSRGALAAAAVGLLAYVVLGRPRALLTGGPVIAISTGIALNVAYSADRLATAEPSSAAAAAQGHAVALVVLICAAAAALVRWTLVLADRRLAVVTISRTARLALRAGGAGTALLAVLAVFVLLDPLGFVERKLEAFVEDTASPSTGDARDRLSQVGNNHRLDHWKVAVSAWRDAPALGHGAGTYQLRWQLRRPDDFTVYDAHSLYLEVLAELGWVGLVLLAVALGAIVVALLWRARGLHRAPYGAAFAAVLAWAVHAGIDWDWEMPAVTLWVFCAGGMALAASAGQRSRPRAPARFTRTLVALGVLVLGLTPVLVAASQSGLDRAVLAFRVGDCPAAVDASLDAIEAIGSRPEPFQILAACDARLGRPDLAVRAMENAVARDSGSWEVHYELAIVRGVARLDPRPAARAALQRNPNEPLARELVRRLGRTKSPREWERRARAARLPFI